MTLEDLQKLNNAIDKLVVSEIAWYACNQHPRGQQTEHYAVFKKLGTARRRVNRLLEKLHLSIAKDQTQ